MLDSMNTPETGSARVPTVRARSRSGGALLLVGLASAAIAASVVLFLLYRPIPTSLATAAAPSEVQLIAENLTDARSVDLTAKLGGESTLNAPGTGTVTRTSCEVGAELKSGSSTFMVGKTPWVNLHTDVPLWRDLSFDMKGDDVSALQRELARLGYAVTESGRFDWQTWVAWDKLVEAAGGDTEYGTLVLGQVIWMPAAKTQTVSCLVRLGQSTAQGEPLITLPTAVLSAAVKSYPSDLVPGDRKLVVDGVDIPVDKAGRLTADGLTLLAGTDTFAQYAQSPEESTLQAELVLTESVTVFPVPPAAVAMTGESSGCVAVPGAGPVAVSVVASKLGRSYITFPHGTDTTSNGDASESDVPDKVQARADKDLACS